MADVDAASRLKKRTAVPLPESLDHLVHRNYIETVNNFITDTVR